MSGIIRNPMERMAVWATHTVSTMVSTIGIVVSFVGRLHHVQQQGASYGVYKNASNDYAGTWGDETRPGCANGESYCWLQFVVGTTILKDSFHRFLGRASRSEMQLDKVEVFALDCHSAWCTARTQKNFLHCRCRHRVLDPR